MITNERQYRITKAHAARFAEAIAELERAPVNPDVHPLLRQAEIDGLRSQHQDLVEELEAYDRLRSGAPVEIAVESIAELPRALITARIARSLTQRELAERLGVKEQQIQRYEATEYAHADFERLRAVMRALGLELRSKVSLG